MKTPMTATRVAKIKADAKRRAKSGDVTHSQALELLAREAGYASWHEASGAAAAASPAEPSETSAEDALIVTRGDGKSSIVVPGPVPHRIETDGDDDQTAAALRKHASKLMESQRRQTTAHEEGLPALKRLFDIAHGHSGQCRFVAAFILGLYNGTRFPFDLTDLRSVDVAIFEDCMRVLRMDAAPRQEVHNYFANGGARFEALARDWRIADRGRLTSICNQIVERGVPSFGGEADLDEEIKHALANTFPDRD